MSSDISYAPGWPGMTPRWTSSAKSGVGASLNPSNRVWFTLGFGILDEVYYGRVDRACTRDMGFIVTDGKDFFSEEKRQKSHELHYIAKGVPAYKLINTDDSGRYRIEKEVIADPRRSVVLQHTRFVPLQGKLSDYHLYILLAPHINNHGAGNTAWVGDVKSIPMLFAERENTALALACSAPWLKRSAGFVGQSDGWQDLSQHKSMTWSYDRAENGNTALTGEIDLQACQGDFLLALGFGEKGLEAGHHARASLLDGFQSALDEYLDEWQSWQKTLLELDQAQDEGREYRISAAVMRVHEAKTFGGGVIASLSIPWGSSKGDDDLGGYHLVWTRDLVESVVGLMAAGAASDAARVLRYLQITQDQDGHWPQNMWLDGTPYWNGIQLDENAFPLLLASIAYREGDLKTEFMQSLWPMVRLAASYVVCKGPVTDEDRWEEIGGYSVFTLAVEIAGLLAVADIAELNHEAQIAQYLRETADTWNAKLDDWVYVTNTPLARQVGVEGYYIRIAPPGVAETGHPGDQIIQIVNHPGDQQQYRASEIVSPDALALVRFGLRAADDPRMVNTVKVIDAQLKVDTPYGPVWHRYTHDGYGEHADGSPFDGTGIGRAWPLLTGERAHYELAAGHHDEARRLARAMSAFANEGGMIPEQVWDTQDIPERGLFVGRPSGSAMPLVWAHAEYVKLENSLRAQRVFDTPPQTRERYLIEKTGSPFDFWRFNHKVNNMPAGQKLRVEVMAAARVHWSTDGWKTFKEIDTQDTSLGPQIADLPTEKLPAGTRVDFTFYWTDTRCWEGQNFGVTIAGVSVSESGTSKTEVGALVSKSGV